LEELRKVVPDPTYSDEEKIEIMKIIVEKCDNDKRSDFKFYQAYFCFEDNCIKKSEMSLIEF
jgi:hypothetical protein